MSYKTNPTYYFKISELPFSIRIVQLMEYTAVQKCKFETKIA